MSSCGRPAAFTVFSNYYSNHGQKSLFAAAESGAPYSVIHVDFFSGQNRSAEFKKINPLATIPALRLEDGTNRTLGECRPIAKYIAENFAEEKLYPKGPQGFTRAKIDEWISFERSNTSPLISIICDETMFVQVSSGAGRKSDAVRLADAVARISSYLDYMENYLSEGNKKYLVNEQFTLADIVFAPEWQILLGTPYADLVNGEKRPNLSAYIKRILDRPEWKNIVTKGNAQMNEDINKVTASGKKLNIVTINGLPRNKTESDNEPISQQHCSTGKK